MGKMEYGALTPEEIQVHEKRKQAKHNLFVFSDAAQYGAWSEINRELNRLKRYPKDPNKKAEKFLALFQNVYTAPENSHPKTLPAYALADLFERSFSFFRHDIKDETKTELAEMQMELMEDKNIPEEARNAMKGIWGYNTDSEKREQKNISEEDIEIREEFLKIVRSIREKYHSNDQIRKSLSKERKQYLYYPEKEIQGIDSKTLEDLKYFGSLYENETVRPLEPDKEGLWIHELARAQERKRYDAMGEIEMPPHVRLYTLEKSNQLPKPDTIDSGKAKLYITEEPEVLEERPRKRKIICTELPGIFFDALRNRADRLRYSRGYKDSSRTVRNSMRRDLIVEFMDDIFDPQSELRKNLKAQEILSSEDIQKLQDAISRYRERGKDIKDLYLAFQIAIGEENEKTV